MSWRDLESREALHLFQTARHQASSTEEEQAVEVAVDTFMRARWPPLGNRPQATWEEADAAIAEMERLLARPRPPGEPSRVLPKDVAVRVKSATTPDLAYLVTRIDGAWSCECKGFEIRRRCRHVDAQRAKHEPA